MVFGGTVKVPYSKSLRLLDVSISHSKYKLEKGENSGVDVLLRMAFVMLNIEV